MKLEKVFLQKIRKMVFQSSFNRKNIYPIIKSVGCFSFLRKKSGTHEKKNNQQVLLSMHKYDVDNYLGENEQVVSWQTG